MVASANGIVAWQRRTPDELPVSEIVGCADRPDRRADRLLMRWLRCFGDAAIGAPTTRAERTLVQTPEEAGDERRRRGARTPRGRRTAIALIVDPLVEPDGLRRAHRRLARRRRAHPGRRLRLPAVALQRAPGSPSTASRPIRFRDRPDKRAGLSPR
jgi:hypothetical protein